MRLPLRVPPHLQPFSPEYRGEESKNLFLVRTSIPNSLSFLEENLFPKHPNALARAVA